MKTTPQQAQTVKFLWYNTFLLHGFSIGSDHQIGAKPHLNSRASELGTQLKKLADSTKDTDNENPKSIFALCEVFSPKTFALIHKQLDARTTRYTTGPRAGLHALKSTNDTSQPAQKIPRWMRNIAKLSQGTVPVSSGLYTLTNGLPITRTTAEPFQLISEFPQQQPSQQAINWNLLNRGHPLRDPDFWANKGILLTEIDLGCGKIELYSTHLFSGQVFGEALLISLRRLQKLQLAGALPFPIPFKKSLQAILHSQTASKLSTHIERYHQFFDLRPPQRLKIQRGQLEQIVDFITRHHRPENIVILTGDFNLDAHDPLSLALLSQAIERLKERGIDLKDTRHTFQKDPNATSTLIPNDLLFNTSTPDQIAQAAAIQSTACAQETTDTQWLDYIFVQKEHAQHNCSLKIIDQSLRPFPRRSTPGQTMHFLSDHIGLEITLRASPRPV